MSRPRSDSDDLPGDLEDILEGDHEPQRPNFDDSDEFDPTTLLSQPFFDDSNGDLDVNEVELADPQATLAAQIPSGQIMSNNAINMNQPSFQQQNNFSSYDQNSLNSSNHQQQMPNNMDFYNNGGDLPILNRAMSPEQQNVNLKVQEVQRKIQQVQEQIQRVQLESASGMVSPQPQQNPISPQHEGLQSNNFDLQAMMLNQVGVTSRNPPGRSVSMPIRRNLMQGAPMNNQPTFMMQQPMQQLQQQQLQQQQAMMGNSNNSANSGSMNNGMNNFNQGMDQQQLMMGNTLDGGSMHNPMNGGMPGFNNNHGFAMDQLQQGMMGASLDGPMHNSMNHNMQGFNQGIMDGSMNGTLNTMQQQGFNNNGLDNSVRSMPGNMMNNNNMGMDMLMLQQQQQQQGMVNMTNMANLQFGDSGVAVRQNSLPHAHSSNIGMLPGNQDNMLGPQNFDLAQMQRAFQAQGLIPGPAGAVQQPQVGQPGTAMEKLCESMRRSAMSRSLVKQLSGRTVVSRTSSGRALTKTHSGRSLSRQNSGRQLQRSASGRTVEADLPVRRLAQDTKFRIQRDALSSSLHAPGRGVFRHKSQSAAMGGSNHKTVLNIDGNSVGMF